MEKKARENALILFLLCQILILVVVIAVQYFQIGQVKKRVQFLQGKLDKIIKERNSFGFPMAASYDEDILGG